MNQSNQMSQAQRSAEAGLPRLPTVADVDAAHARYHQLVTAAFGSAKPEQRRADADVHAAEASARLPNGLSREVADDIAQRQRPGGLPGMPDQQLLEASDPQARQRYVQQLSGIATRFGAEVWGVTALPHSSVLWKYHNTGHVFRVSPVGQTVRQIPSVVYLRIQAILAAGYKVSAWYWGDEQDPPFPFTTRGEVDAWQRSLGRLDSPDGLDQGLGQGLGQGLSQDRRAEERARQAREEALRPKRDPLVIAATRLDFTSDDALFVIMGKWLELHA